MVNLLGINIGRLFTLIFAFGAAMAGLAGILAGPIMGSLHPELGNPVLLGSFVVVVIGGMGSFTGAIVGAILVGLTKALTTMLWAPGSNVIIFILMALILVIRTQGLLGKRLENEFVRPIFRRSIHNFSHYSGDFCPVLPLCGLSYLNAYFRDLSCVF